MTCVYYYGIKVGQISNFYKTQPLKKKSTGIYKFIKFCYMIVKEGYFLSIGSLKTLTTNHNAGAYERGGGGPI